MENTIKQNENLQVILKLPGKSCNLDCVYCYEKQRNYKYSSYIDAALLKKFISLLDGRDVSFQLHGGEPLLLGIKNIREIISILKKYTGNIKINIQTNATLLNEEWLNLFNEEYPDIELGISLDGNNYANSFRVDYKGNFTIKKVEKALRLCEKRKRNIGIISVVNKRMLNNVSSILAYFKEFSCIKVINFTPCFDYKIKVDSKPNECVINNYEYNQFLIEVFNEWQQQGLYKHYFIDPIYSIIRRLYGKNTSLCHFNTYKCTHMLTLYPDGMLGSCDEVSTEYGYYGNVYNMKTFQDLLEIQSTYKLFQDIKDINNKCSVCNYMNVCQEGCIASRRNFKKLNLEYNYCNERVRLINYIKEKLGGIYV